MIRETEIQIEKIKEKVLKKEERKRIVEKYTNLEELNRETLDILIDSIYVGKRNPETKEVPVEIRWNF